ncbi:hypothetical protein [Candidatus Electrothrix sp.]|uniref:hypothetical protein n=1 Tax=Candidatus Electrothrix sp. TaxID=2170559 RepID=UPI0040560240
MEQALKEKQITFAQIMQAMMVLTGGGHACPVQEDAVISKVKKTSRALNTHLMNSARSSSDITALASPVTGGGITVGRFDQLFALAVTLSLVFIRPA